MIVERMPVGIVIERRPAASRWQDHVWHVTAVLPGRPETAPWTVLAQEGGVTRFYAGTTDLTLYSGETEVYKHNLEAAEPAVFVVFRRDDAAPQGLRLLLATIDPAEAHAHGDTGDDLLERLPMPPLVRAWADPFVARHHKERVHWKRKRDKADPEALAHREPGAGFRGDWEE